MDYQKLLLEQLDLIDRVVQYVARRHHLAPADTDEFNSVVRFKLIDRDFAVLRKFEGRSNLATYLTAVVERTYLDYCASRWGKWRPSAYARRLGAVAVLLEQLVGRDGLTFDEAVGTLQTNHRVTATREELHAIFRELPLRTVRRYAGEEELALVAATTGGHDGGFDRDDDQALVATIEQALAAALEKLPTEDQLIVKFRYHDNLTVPQLSRLLRLDAKSLYRRLEQIVATLRAELTREGIDDSDTRRLIGHPELLLGRILADGIRDVSPENGDLGPSKG